MPTIVSCPKCRDQVTLPPEPYSGLICPHCQVEFSMQPTLRQPAPGAYSSLRQELAREARAGLSGPQRPVSEVSLAEVGDRVIALPPRRLTSALTVACHVIGLLGGGALGLVAGYCLLTYWGGSHFNVLELPLPWLPPLAAQSPSEEPAQTPQAATARPSGAAAPSNSAASAASPAKPRSQAAPRIEPLAAAPDGGPRLTAASHVEALASGAANSGGGAVLPTEARRNPAARDSAPQHSLEELTRAVSAARDALACPTCKSTGLVTRSSTGRESAQRCPVCRGAGGTGITAEVYGKLCGLAEVATHADASDEDVLKARQNLARVFRKAADRPEKQAAIGRHAAQRMTAPPGDAKGILLVGTIDRKESLGPYHATRLVLMGEPSPVVVLSGTPVPFSPGERAIIAGSVIADPTVELPGYAGPRGPAVWGGMPLRLEE